MRKRIALLLPVIMALIGSVCLAQVPIQVQNNLQELQKYSKHPALQAIYKEQQSVRKTLNTIVAEVRSLETVLERLSKMAVKIDLEYNTRLLVTLTQIKEAEKRAKEKAIIEKETKKPKKAASVGPKKCPQ